MHGSEIRSEDFKGYVDPEIVDEDPAESAPAQTEVETPAEEPETEQPIVEEPTEEPVETEPPKPVETEVAEPEVKKPSRAESRIKELVAENKRLAAQAAMIETLPPIQPEGEMDASTLNQLIDQRAMQVARVAMSQIQTNNELTQYSKAWSDDLDKVKQEHPELDPTSPSYDAELDATLAKMLDDGTGKPRLDILVSDAVKPFFKHLQTSAKTAEDKGKLETSATLARQIAEGAVTPTPKSTPKQEEYSDDELAKMSEENPFAYLKLIKQRKI